MTQVISSSNSNCETRTVQNQLSSEKMVQVAKNAILESTLIVNSPSLTERVIVFFGDLFYAIKTYFVCCGPFRPITNCLIQAIQADNYGLVRGLLFRGADIDGPGADDVTPLQAAYNKDNIPMIMKILSSGADPILKDGSPILCQAIRDLKENLVSALINANVGINEAEPKEGDYPLFLAYRLKSFPLMKQLLEKGAIVRFPTALESNIFHKAVEDKNFTLALRLLKEGLIKLDPNSTPDQDAFKTAMQKKEGAPLVKYMVEQGFDVNAKDKQGFTALAYAFDFGTLDLALFLAEHQATFMLSPVGQAPRNLLVEVCKKQGWSDVALKLFNNIPSMLESSTRLQNHKNAPNYGILKDNVRRSYLIDPETHRSVLHFAIEGGNTKLALVLIDKGVDVTIKDKDRMTAFDLAVMNGNVDVALALLGKGAQDSTENPALLVAYKKVIDLASQDSVAANYKATLYRALIEALIQRGFDVKVKDSRGNSIGDLAIKAGDFVFAVDLKRLGCALNPALIQKLDNTNYRRFVTAMIQLDPQTQKRSSPQGFLFGAAQRGDVELIQLLIDAGASIVKVLPSDGATALQIALRSKKHDAFMYLLSKHLKADPQQLEIVDKEGRTALHIAVQLGNVDAVEALLPAKANPNSISKTGLTPLHYACAYGKTEDHYKIASLLIRAGASKEAKDTKGRTPEQLIPQDDSACIKEVFELSSKGRTHYQNAKSFVKAVLQDSLSKRK